MDMRENVIKALEFCLMPPANEELMSDVCSHDDCPYFREYKGGKCIEAVCMDALALLKEDERAIKFQSDRVDALLKEQAPVKPVVDIDTWKCGYCGHTLEHQQLLGDNVLYHEQYDYCPQCGKAVAWE